MDVWWKRDMFVNNFWDLYKRDNKKRWKVEDRNESVLTTKKANVFWKMCQRRHLFVYFHYFKKKFPKNVKCSPGFKLGSSDSKASTLTTRSLPQPMKAKVFRVNDCVIKSDLKSVCVTDERRLKGAMRSVTASLDACVGKDREKLKVIEKNIWVRYCLAKEKGKDWILEAMAVKQLAGWSLLTPYFEWPHI